MNSALHPRPGYFTDSQVEIGHAAAAHIASQYVLHNLATEAEATRMAHAASDAIRLYRRMVDMASAGPLQTRTCRCGMMIIRTDDEQPWVHADRDASRGCRAASFTHERGWDDAINRRWTATPV